MGWPDTPGCPYPPHQDPSCQRLVWSLDDRFTSYFLSSRTQTELVGVVLGCKQALEKLWEVLTRLVEVVSRNQTPLSLTAFYQPMSNRLECIPGQHPPWFYGWMLHIQSPAVSSALLLFNCTGQLTGWPFDFSIIRALGSCRTQMCPFWQLIRRMRRHEMTNKKTKTLGMILWFGDLVTQLTIHDKLRNWNHDIEG